MSITPTYPGVYIEEVPSGVHTIMGVATSITAFIGRAQRGPVNEPTIVNSYGDYERKFGGLWLDSTMSYAVRDFFQNGGTQAVIVRLFKPLYADADRAAALDAEKAKATAAADAVRDAADAADNDTAEKVARDAADAAKAYADSADYDAAEKAAAAAVLKAALDAGGKTPSVRDIVDAVNAKAAEYAAAAGDDDKKAQAAAAVAKAGADAMAKPGATIATALADIDAADGKYDAGTPGREAADAVMNAAHAASTKAPTLQDVADAASAKAAEYADTAAPGYSAAKKAAAAAVSKAASDALAAPDATMESVLNDVDAADGTFADGTPEREAANAVMNAAHAASAKVPTLQDVVDAAHAKSAEYAAAIGDDDVKKAKAAAAVARAAGDAKVQLNATMDSVLSAVDAAASKYKNNPEKEAADAVKAAAHAAKDKKPTAADLKAAAAAAAGPAAENAASMAAPLQKARLMVDTLTLEAINDGAWGNKLRARVDYATRKEEAGEEGTLFNLYIKDGGTGQMEVIRNLSIMKGHPRQVDRALAQESALVRMPGTALPGARPAKSPDATPGNDPFGEATSTGVTTDVAADSQPLTQVEYMGSDDLKTGIYALNKSDLFNLLCIPPDVRDGPVDKDVYGKAMAYCVRRRAMLIVDPPLEWGSIKEEAASRASSNLANLNLAGTDARNAMIYFPRVKQTDPLHDGQVDVFPACGIYAGIIAKTDAQHGIWNAPAGIEAGLSGIQGLQANLNDAESGMLNPLGINCLRIFPGSGAVVWGARTLRGDDRLADEYKYIPVRRMALYIEECLYRGTQWAVFKPNDEPLWAQLRLNVGSFMHGLFRQGAFKGKTPREAYFVKCDAETTTQDDINRGIVNIIVGFAPLKPAEFVIISIQQIIGDLQA